MDELIEQIKSASMELIEKHNVQDITIYVNENLLGKKSITISIEK